MKTEVSIDVVLIRGEVRCVYLNDYRIVGSKPYVAENPKYISFTTTEEEISNQFKKEESK